MVISLTIKVSQSSVDERVLDEAIGELIEAPVVPSSRPHDFMQTPASPKKTEHLSAKRAPEEEGDAQREGGQSSTRQRHTPNDR